MTAPTPKQRASAGEGAAASPRSSVVASEASTPRSNLMRRTSLKITVLAGLPARVPAAPALGDGSTYAGGPRWAHRSP